MAQTVKNPPAVRETWVQSLGWEDPLEKGMTTHSSILAWRIPWTEELGGYSPWGCKELDTTERLTHTRMCVYIYMYMSVLLSQLILSSLSPVVSTSLLSTSLSLFLS